MAAKIRNTITETAYNKKMLKDKYIDGFYEWIAIKYKQNPFKLDELNNIVKATPNMKEYYIFKSNYYSGDRGIYSSEFKMNNINFDINNFTTEKSELKIDESDYKILKQNGCTIVKQFFQKANKENNWNFEINDRCFAENPTYSITW